MIQQLLNKHKSIKLLLFIIIITQIGFLLYYMNNKEALFVDEAYTYSMANSSYGTLFPCSNLKFIQEIDNNNCKWLDGSFFRDYVAVSNNHRFNYSCIDEMHLFDSHPPFYCYLLHTISSLFPESFSVWYAFSLNLILFIGTQLLLFNISRRIFNSEKYALLISFIYGFSSTTIDCFVYIRMYSLSTFFVLLLLNVYLICLDNKQSLFRFISIVIIVLFGGLTHYHFLVFAFFLSLIFVVVSLIEKKNNAFFTVAFSAVIGVLLFFLRFPGVLFQFENTPRAAEALDMGKITSSSINGISFFFQEFYNSSPLLGNYVSILFVAMFFVILCILFAKKYITNISHSVFYITAIPTILFFIFISFSVGFYSFGIQGERFFFIAYPLIVVTLIVFLAKIKFFIFCLALISLISSFVMVDFNFKDYEGFNSELEKLFDGNNIVLYCEQPEILEVLSVKLLRCNKVMIVPYATQNWFPKEYSKDEKTYLVFVNHNKKLNLPFKLIKESKYYDLRYSVYDLVN